VRNFEKADGEPDASWTPIGAAWVHQDGNGFKSRWKALPLDGRLVMRLNKAKEKKV
jgi:hypothetical protein